MRMWRNEHKQSDACRLRVARDNNNQLGKFAEMRFYKYADVAELADALDSGSSESNFMWVQLPSSAPCENTPTKVGVFLRGMGDGC